jgi:hypothetical protein
MNSSRTTAPASALAMPSAMAAATSPGSLIAGGLRAERAADLGVTAAQGLEAEPFLGDALVIAVAGHLGVVHEDDQHRDLVADRGLQLQAALPERGVAEEADRQLVRRGHLRAQREAERGAERRGVAPAQVAPGPGGSRSAGPGGRAGTRSRA